MSQEGGHFAPDWLSLREPVDVAARSPGLVDRLDAWLVDLADLADNEAPKFLDLGAGHGSNVRYLAPRLHGRQEWLLIDHDPDLLDHAASHCPAESLDGRSISVQCHTADLNELAWQDVPHPAVVTANALLDLCSRNWIQPLVSRMSRWRCAGLFSLNVDGQRYFIDAGDQRMDHREDERMAAWFNDHQRQDKGLGQALGPDAINVLAAGLEQAGFVLYREWTPWRLSAGDPNTMDLARIQVNGWRQAALDMLPRQVDFIERWYRQRLDWLARGQAGLVVGHADLLAIPASHG